MMNPTQRPGPHQSPGWLEIERGRAPLVVAFPHTGTDIPEDIEAQLASPWLARKDTDWSVHRLYDFARTLGATTIRTTLSRTVIDVNRDPSGASLYPGQATTELCPTITFDGEPLYRSAEGPSAAEIERRRRQFFDPYHEALRAELERLRAAHGIVVLYDAHSIRSRIPRLFDGVLPNFNIGTNGGATCDPALTAAVERALGPAGEGASLGGQGFLRTDATGRADAAGCARAAPPFSRVTNGRFKGGWTVRHHGQPARGVHAIQMELACRTYVEEPASLDGPGRSGEPVPIAPDAWPPDFDPARAEPARAALAAALGACIDFAGSRSGDQP